MPHTALRTVLRASWYAIGLGLLLQAVQIGVLAAGGAKLPPLAATAADAAQKVSWSFIVCVALACGTALARAGPGAMSALGLLAAPLAFAAARALHKTVAQVLDISVPGGGPSPWLLAGIKAAEYALFGWLIARLIHRPEPRPWPYVRTGLLIGVGFGALFLWALIGAAPAGLPTTTLAARAINELLFPVGCACLLWVTGTLSRRVS
jgi:hypothetical protein